MEPTRTDQSVWLSPEELDRLRETLEQPESPDAFETVGHGHYAGAVRVHRDFPQVVIKKLSQASIEARLANVEKGRQAIEKHKLNLLCVPRAAKIVLATGSQLLVQERMALTPYCEKYLGELYLGEERQLGGEKTEKVVEAVRQLAIYGHYTHYYDFKGDNIWWLKDWSKLAILDHEQPDGFFVENFEHLSRFAALHAETALKVWQPLQPELVPLDPRRLEVEVDLAELREWAIAEDGQEGDIVDPPLTITDKQALDAPSGTGPVYAQLFRKLQKKNRNPSLRAFERRIVSCFQPTALSSVSIEEAEEALRYLEEEAEVIRYCVRVRDNCWTVLA